MAPEQRRVAFQSKNWQPNQPYPQGIGEWKWAGFKAVFTHSLRAGCATTLYAEGIDPVDIQRWGRWKCAIYMRYIWRGNLRLRHLSFALTSQTKLMGRLTVDLDLARKVNSQDDFRAGSSSKSNITPDPQVLHQYDFLVTRSRGHGRHWGGRNEIRIGKPT